MATELRTSSVSGLKVRPQTAIFLSFKHPERVAEFADEAVEHADVDALDFLEQLERRAELLADGDEGLHVLRESSEPP